MNREILFRGKQTDDGEWAYGYYFYDNFQDKAFITFGNNCFKIGNYCMSLDRECPNKRILSAFEVIPETVGQYTGLTNKNGTKIFEGDIVDFFNIRGKIVNECGAFGIAVSPNIDYDLLESKIPFNNNANFCFNDNFISLWELWWNYEQNDNLLYEVEIIGNIHDNPELMEVSE